MAPALAGRAGRAGSPSSRSAHSSSPCQFLQYFLLTPPHPAPGRWGRVASLALAPQGRCQGGGPILGDPPIGP